MHTIICLALLAFIASGAQFNPSDLLSKAVLDFQVKLEVINDLR